MNRRIAVALAIWVFLGIPVSSPAASETPGSRDACQIEPSAWTLSDPREMLDAFWRVADTYSSDGQGYDVYWLVQMDESITPAVTLADFKAELGYGDGLFTVASHGKDDRLYVELYPGTSEGQDSMEAAYWRYYFDSFICNNCFIWGGGPTDGYYGIGVTPVGIETWYRSANSIVYIISCNSSSYSDRWQGARNVLAYDYGVTPSVAESEAESFWARMNGEAGKSYRQVQTAITGLTLVPNGDGDTMLSPTVESYYPDEFTSIGEDSVEAWAVFDTRMDLDMDPALAVYGNGNLSVTNEEWRRGEKDTLRYTLKSVFAGLGKIHINENAMSEGGLSLDGNQDPAGTDGTGPNRDDYVISYVCTHGGDNPAARVEAQWAYRREGGVVVGWHSVAEWNTKSYAVEAGDGVGWRTVGTVSRGDVLIPGVYEIAVPDGYDLYRVVELDKTGKRCEFHPVRVPDSGGESLAGMIQEYGLSEQPNHVDRVRSEDICWYRTKDRAAALQASGQVPDWVFYGPDSLLAETAPAISWFESKGLAVDTVWAPAPDH